MADVGRTTVGVNTRAVNGSALNGLRVVMPEAGQQGVTISVYLEDTAAGDLFRTVIVNDSDRNAVLAYSDSRTNISTTGWYTFSGGTLSTFTPANGTAYIIMCGSESAAGANMYEDDQGAVDGFSGQASDLGATPPTIFFDVEPDVRDFSIYMTYTPESSSVSEPVVHAQAVFQGQSIPLGITAPLINGQAVFQGQNVGTISSVPQLVPVVAGQAAFEGQQIPFIFGTPGDEGQLVGEGGEITFAIRISGLHGQAVFQGQEVPTLANQGARVIVVSADAVFAPSAITLISTGISSVDDMVQDSRTMTRPMAFIFSDTDR